MKVRTGMSQALTILLGCALLMVSLESVASGFSNDLYSDVGRYDVHSLDGNGQSAIPLVSFTLSAATDSMRGNALDFTASYRGVGVKDGKHRLGYKEISAAFSLTAPNLSGLDFSKSIRDKVEDCPEKMINRLIIDGAVGFNFSW